MEGLEFFEEGIGGERLSDEFVPEFERLAVASTRLRNHGGRIDEIGGSTAGTRRDDARSRRATIT
jgi:hypothetical protein